MTEITSFNQIFSEAASAGLLLETFCQTDRGLWRARWRRQEPKAWFAFVEHERPFDALLLAMLVAVKRAPAVVDLFG